LLERVRSLLKNKVCKTNPSIELQLENLNSLILLPTKGADATAAEDDDEVDSNEAMLIDMFLNSSRLVKKIQVVDCSDLATALKLYAIRVLLGNLRNTKSAEVEASIVRVVCTLMENDTIETMQKRSTQLLPSYIGDFVSRNPAMSWALVPALVHMCQPPASTSAEDDGDAKAATALLGGARKPFLRCESFRVLGSVLSSNMRSETACHTFAGSKFLTDAADTAPATLSVREHLEARIPELMKVLAVGLESPELSKGKHVKALLQYAKALISCMTSHSVSLALLQTKEKKGKNLDLQACFQKTIENTNSDGVKAVAMQLLQMLNDNDEAGEEIASHQDDLSVSKNTKKKKKKGGPK